MKEALEFHFEGMIEDGEPLPQSDGVSAYQEIARETAPGSIFSRTCTSILIDCR